MVNKHNMLYILATFFVLITIVVSGCGKVNSQQTVLEEQGQEEASMEEYTEEKETVELNERQKEILKSVGLSENYKELTETQKSAIINIEKGLSYMDEKYGREFIYLGYIPLGVLDEEQLTCYEKGTLPERIITVYYYYEDEKMTLQDDFEKVCAGDIYSQAVLKYVTEELGYERTMACTEVKIINGDISEENVIKNTYADCAVFFEQLPEEKIDLNSICEKLKKWILEENQGASGFVRLFILNKEAFHNLTGYNYQEILDEFGSEQHLTLTIYEDGTYRIK